MMVTKAPISVELPLFLSNRRSACARLPRPFDNSSFARVQQLSAVRPNHQISSGIVFARRCPEGSLKPGEHAAPHPASGIKHDGAGSPRQSGKEGVVYESNNLELQSRGPDQ